MSTRCESEEYLGRNSGSRSPLGSTRRQGPLGEDVGCWQVGRGGNQDQAEEEEQMLGSQLAELQQKLDRFVFSRLLNLELSSKHDPCRLG